MINQAIFDFLLNAGIIGIHTKVKDDHNNMELFEAAVKSVQPEKQKATNTRLEISTLAYLAWTENRDRLIEERRKLKEELDQIQAACPHNFRYESNLKQVGMGVHRCVACRVVK